MSLKVWLPFNGDIINRGGCSGIFSGSPGYSTGKVSQKALSSGNITMPASIAEQVFNNPEITVCFWMYNGGSSGIIFGTDGMTPPNNRRFSLYQYPSSNDLHFSWQSYDSSSTFTGGVAYGALPLNEWSHICATFESTSRQISGEVSYTGNSKIFVNGVLVASTNNVTYKPGTSFYDTIIARANGSRYINDLRIYDEALSIKEIKELAKGLSVHYDFSNLFGKNLVTGSMFNENFTCTETGYIKSNNTDTKSYFEFQIQAWNGDTYVSGLITQTLFDGVSCNYNIVLPSGTNRIRLKHNGSVRDLTIVYVDNLTPGISYNIKFDVISANPSFNGGIVINNLIVQTLDTIIDKSGYENDGKRTNGSFKELPGEPDYGLNFIEFKSISDPKIEMRFSPSYLTNCTICWWQYCENNNVNRLFMSGQDTSHYIAAGNASNEIYHSNSGSPILYIDGVKGSDYYKSGWHFYCLSGVNLSSWTTSILNSYAGDWSIRGNVSDIKIFATQLSDSDIENLYFVKASVDNHANLYCAGFKRNTNLDVNNNVLVFNKKGIFSSGYINKKLEKPYLTSKSKISMIGEYSRIIEREYLESKTYDCCINTGVNLDSSIETEIMYSFTSTDSSERYVYGSDSRLVLGMISGRGRIYVGNLSAHWSYTLNSTDVHVARIGKNIILDGEIKSTNTGTWDSGSNAYLFCSNATNQASPRYFSKARIYYCKMWKNGVLIRDFIPCSTGSGNGLYDKIENKFYQNSNSSISNFSVGPSIGSLSSININKQYIGNINYNESDFIQLKYIQGTGTQYINTGYSSTNGIAVEYGANWQTAGYICGSHGSNSPYGRNGGYIRELNSDWELGYGDTYPRNYDTIPKQNTNYNVEFSTLYSGAYLKINGVGVISSQSQYTSDTNVFLFTNQYNISNNLNPVATSAKLFYCRIKDPYGHLVRDFVPCIYKYDGSVGMYDRVTKGYFRNSGTGEFIPGPVISDNIDIFVQTIPYTPDNSYWRTIWSGSGYNYTTWLNSSQKKLVYTLGAALKWRLSGTYTTSTGTTRSFTNIEVDPNTNTYFNTYNDRSAIALDLLGGRVGMGAYAWIENKQNLYIVGGHWTNGHNESSSLTVTISITKLECKY